MYWCLERMLRLTVILLLMIPTLTPMPICPSTNANNITTTHKHTFTFPSTNADAKTGGKDVTRANDSHTTFQMHTCKQACSQAHNIIQARQLHVHIYIYIYTCMYVCMYIYIYIYTRIEMYM